MRISEHLREFYLHDGRINHIQYLPEKNSLYIDVKLTEESEVGWFGQFVFKNVRILEADPPFESIKWENIDWTSISTTIHLPDEDQNGLEATLWTASVHYVDRSYGGLFLKFLAETFEWEPDLSKPSPYQ